MIKCKNLMQLFCCLLLMSAQSLRAECGVFTSVESAYLHSLALRSDGSVWGWGHNNYGQVGNGTTQDVLSPVKVSTLPAVTSCTAGFYHSLAIASDGTIWTWGNNQNGQLGNGTTVDSATPAQVVGGLTNVIAVAGGGFHSLALKSDGTVWAWGYNYYGQLGNGGRGPSSVPIQVQGLTNVTAIACGGYFSLALKSDGTVWAWGNNLYGQLGNGTTSDSYVPVQVPGLISVTQIAAGSLHALAYQTDGTLWAWGNNQYGQLGNNMTVNSSMPAQVLGISNIAAIAGGGFHSLALTTDKKIWTWGSDYYGQLGNGSTGSQSLVPIQVTSSNVQSVSAIAGGYYHSLALTTDATAWGWGHNAFGEIGNNSMIDTNTPIQVDYPIPTVTASPASQTLCNGSTTSIRLSSNTGGTISWTVSENNVTGATSGSGSIIEQQLSLVNPSVGGSVTYTVAVTDTDGCMSAPLYVPVAVSPIPVATATPAVQTISNNQTTSITLTSSVSGTTFCWTAASTNVQGASDGCGSLIRQRLKLASSPKGPLTGSVTYTVTPTVNGCMGTPIVVTVNVVK